jgi:hypothetical protein
MSGGTGEVRKLGLGLVLALSVLMCGCGGSGGGGQQPPTSISVSISPSTQTQIDQGQTVDFTAAVTNDSGNQGVTWSASGSGCMGASCGTFANATATSATYNAPASVSGTLTVTVTATSVADTSKSKSSTLTVAPAPQITTTTLPKASPNVSYNATLQASGGVGTISWSLAAGSLPTGLQLNSAGQIYGTPTSSSTSDSTATLTLQVTDSSQAAGGPVSSQQSLSLTIIGVLTVVTTSLPDGTVNSPYGASIEAVGGTLPIVWSSTLTTSTACSGATLEGMPPGLVLTGSSNTNVVPISGTPTTVGSSDVTYNFCATATDSSPTPQTYSRVLSITIHPPGPLSITSTALPNGVVNQPYYAGLAATGGTPPYTWAVTSGSQPGWLTVSNLGVLSGPTPTEGTSTFSVTVTDSSTQQQQATQSLTLTVNPAAAACTSSGNEAVLNGQYAFSLSGFNAQGFLTVVGSFTADGAGNITAGEADTNGVLGAQTGNLITTAAVSSYHVGLDNRGCATLATPFGTFVTRFALGSLSSGIATKGHIMEWDYPNPNAYIASGRLSQQDPSVFSSGLSGSFVFRTLGWDPSASGGRTACIGIIVGNRAVFRSLEQYCNDAGAVASPPAFVPAGTYSTFDGNGRGTGIASVEITTPGGTTTSTTYLTLYMVSGSEFLMVNSDPFPTVSGEMQRQSPPTGGGGFTQNSLQGNMVFYLTGSSNSGAGAAVSVETATGDSSISVLTLQAYEDRLGTWQGPPPMTVTCTYTVGTNGRVTLTNPSGSDSCGINPPILYMTAANTGLLIDAASGVDIGSFEPQAAGIFSNASLSGTFFTGPTEVVSQSIGKLSVGEVTMTPGSGAAGSITGTEFVTSTTTPPASQGDSPIADTYSVNPDGTFTTGSTSPNVVGIVINSNKFVMIDDVSSAYPILFVLEK